MRIVIVSIIFVLFFTACGTEASREEKQEAATATEEGAIAPNTSKYEEVILTSDLSHLTADQKEMVRLLIQAGEIMDELFWYEAYGEKEMLLRDLADDAIREFVRINKGPWDRLENNAPFLEGVGPKPAGANFYPHDMTKEEFEAADLPGKEGLYNFIRRDENGRLIAVPYHKQFGAQIAEASRLLQRAAELAEEPGLKKYLGLRAEALTTDNYQASDMAWMDMKNNMIEVVIGPIETYEDQLYGYKAAHECYVLIKDMDWSARLAKYADFLPELQAGLPVPEAYRKELPGGQAELNAYDVVFAGGDGNAGSKTIAINLPNDEQVQIEKGSRRLQLKNAMKAKFDKILLPISGVLLDEDQRKHITFNAFFSNTMFHEVAHGLGIKEVVGNESLTVRKALKEHASALEEGKADILGLYMIKQLYEKGELEGELEDYYVTFMTSIFRSVRFGASSAHGKANMIRFNFFKEYGAFTRSEESGTYTVNFSKLEEAVTALSSKILTLQGDGNYAGVAELVAEKGIIGPQLQADLDRLADADIPVDIVYEQGIDILGL